MRGNPSDGLVVTTDLLKPVVVVAAYACYLVPMQLVTMHTSELPHNDAAVVLLGVSSLEAILLLISV